MTEEGKGPSQLGLRHMSAMTNGDHIVFSDDASVDTLAAFLTDTSEISHTDTSNDVPTSTSSLEATRQNQIEKQVVINALNRFILQAGNIYKGEKLSTFEESKLRDAATHAGLSMQVVDALLEQTADQNAAVDYCMASDDAFARKIREDPHKGGDGLNVTNSIWRIFIHKIIKQLLKDQNMQLGDIMEKPLLTSRLYEEASKCDPSDSQIRLTRNMLRLPRDYSEERKHVFIAESDAKLARIEAESKMEFQSRKPFHDIANRNLIHKLPPSEDYVESRDDDFSTIPCATQQEIPRSLRTVSEINDNLRDENCLSMIPCAAERRAASSPKITTQKKNSLIAIAPENRSTNRQGRKVENEGTSAVKRGLEMFEKSIKSQVNNVSPVKGRKLEQNASLSGNVSKARAMFEKVDCLAEPNKRLTSSDIHKIKQNKNAGKVFVALIQQEQDNNFLLLPKNENKSNCVEKSNARVEQQKLLKCRLRESKKSEFTIESSNEVQRRIERTKRQQCDPALLINDETTFRNLPKHEADCAIGAAETTTNQEDDKCDQFEKSDQQTSNSRDCSEDSQSLNDLSGQCNIVMDSVLLTNFPKDEVFETFDTPFITEDRGGISRELHTFNEQLFFSPFNLNEEPPPRQSHERIHNNTDDRNNKIYSKFSSISDRFKSNNLSIDFEIQTDDMAKEFNSILEQISSRSEDSCMIPIPPVEKDSRLDSVSEEKSRFEDQSDDVTREFELNLVHSSAAKEECNGLDGVFEKRRILSERPVSYHQTVVRNSRSRPNKTLCSRMSEENMSVVSKSKKYFEDLLQNDTTSSILSESSCGSILSSGSTSKYNGSNLDYEEGYVLGHDQYALQQIDPSLSFNQKRAESTWETFDSKFDAKTKDGDNFLVGSIEGMTLTNVDNNDQVDHKVNSIHSLLSSKESIERTVEQYNSSQGLGESYRPIDNRSLNQVSNTWEEKVTSSKQTPNRIGECLPDDHHIDIYSHGKQATEHTLLCQDIKNNPKGDSLVATQCFVDKIGEFSEQIQSSSPLKQESTYETNNRQGNLSLQYCENDEYSQSSSGSEFDALNPLSRNSETAKFTNLNTNSVTLNEYNSIREHHRGLREFLEQREGMHGEDIQQQRSPLEQSQINKLQCNGDKSEQHDHFEALNAFLAEYQHDENKCQRNIDTSKHYPSESLNTIFGEQQRDEMMIQSPQCVDDNLQNLSSTGSNDDNTAGMKKYSRNYTELQLTGEMHHYDLEVDQLTSTLSDTLQVETVTSGKDDDGNGLRDSYEVSWPITNEAGDQTENLEMLEEYGVPTPKTGHRVTQYHATNILDRPLLDLNLNNDQSLDAVEEERQSSDILLHQELDPSPHYTDNSIYQNDPKPDPSPEGGRRSIDTTSTPRLNNTTEVPEGASKEEFSLLNRFIEVASTNFGGNKLSVESESRVRSAALKVGLASKFVDQLLKQNRMSEVPDSTLTYDALQHPHHSELHQPASHENENKYQNYYSPYRHDSVPATLNDYGGEDSTYYTADYTRTTNQNRKREPTFDGCNAWGSIRENLGFLAKTCGINNFDRDDASSAVSAISWEDENDGLSRVRRRRSRGKLRDDDKTDSLTSGHNEVQHDVRIVPSPSVRNDDQQFERKMIRQLV